MDERHERKRQAEEPDPHHALNNPVGKPDPTEWPDPYDVRDDPLDASNVGEEPRHTPHGATSTSEPHPDSDPGLEGGNPPKRSRER
jgi:hypothetical protein